MKNTFYLFLLLLIFCCASCEKENPADFRIIDAATKAGIPNATVALFEKESNGFVSPPSRTLVEIVETDEEGVYNFTYSLSGDRTYDVSVDADTYWQSTWNSYPRSPTIEMDPEGYVKVKMRKVDTTEYAKISINTASVSLGNIQFSGNEIDTVFTDTYRGGKSLNFTWWIAINEVKERTIGEDIYFPPHDTTTFEIIF